MSSLGLIRDIHLNLWDIGNYYGLTDLGVDLYLCGKGFDVDWDEIMRLYPAAKPFPYSQPHEVLDLELDVLDIPDAHYGFSQYYIGRHPRVVMVAWDNLPGKNTTRPKAIRALQNCWKCVGRSELACKTLEFDGVDPGKIRLIYGAVDTEFFRPKPLEDRSNTVLFVGRLTLEKGLLDLLWAMEGIDAPLWIVGEGDTEPLKFWIDRNPNIELMGFVGRDRLRELYQQARVFCAPSVPKLSHNPDEAWLEQFGQVFLEAMACGLPVVSTLSGAIPEVVGYYDQEEFPVCGTFAFPRDWGDIREGITFFLEYADMWEKASTKARKRAGEKFSQQVIAERIKDWYEL